jgi:ribosomal-protein-alanine N-acetyltransferase
MQRTDIDDVARIEAAVSPQPWSVSLFDGEFSVDPETRHWLVADAVDPGGSSRLVGFAGMMFVGVGGDGEGHLMNLAVDLDHRRRGVAQRLCASLFDVAADRGLDALTLEVRSSNTAAIQLYRRFGFAPVGVRTAYYRNPDGSKENGLIMWLHDNIARRSARIERSRA